MKSKFLDEVDSIIHGERQDQYGKAEDSFQTIAELWSGYLTADLIRHNILEKENAYIIDTTDVAFLMTLFKIGREMHQHKRDNLIDACGYLTLAGEMYND